MAGAPCVLELKFTDRFPHWFREMSRALNLERRSNAKYVQTAFWVPRKGDVAPHGSEAVRLAELIAGAD
jgi:hypothetical protein